MLALFWERCLQARRIHRQILVERWRFLSLLGAKVGGCIISYLRMKLGNLWKSGNFPGFSYLWIAANGHLEGWKNNSKLGTCPSYRWMIPVPQFQVIRDGPIEDLVNQHFARPKHPLKCGESVEHGRNKLVFWIQHNYQDRCYELKDSIII